MKKIDKTLKQSAKGFNDVMGPVASIAKTVAPLAPLLLALGEGDMETKPVKPKRIRVPKEPKVGDMDAKKSKRIRVPEPKVGGGRHERGQIVKQIMKERGLTLPMASRYVKENGLYEK